MASSSSARKGCGTVARPSNRERRGGPAKRIIKSRKPLSERKRNCDAQNALLDDSIRKEYLRDEGFDPFAPPTPGETMQLYIDRHAEWQVVGKARSGWAQGAKASMPECSARKARSVDVLYWARLESDKIAAFDVVRSMVNGPPELTEVEAVFLALRGHSEVAKGREIVREAARAVAVARNESVPTENEINLVLASLHLLGS